MSTEPTPQPKLPSSKIQQNVTGSNNQSVGEMSGGTAFGTVEGNISIYNYYYQRESVDSESIESTDSVGDENLLCPYRGLFHFGPNDAEYFFGREVFVEELFAATKTRNFIPVLGASGSGKSSVVLAGLVPRLIQESDWLFTHFRPGSEPFYALAEALVPLYMSELDSTDKMTQAGKLAKSLNQGELSLAKVFSNIQRKYPNHRVLLIADQFEELYTLCSEQKVRHSFLDTLLACFQSSSSQSQYNHVLVATMRADFLGNALSYPKFGEVLRNSDVKIRSMKREELREVIVKPAEKLGVNFEAGLVERILNDVDSQPGNLPLLEFALTQLWKQRRGKLLTHAGYEKIGEVEGALVCHADEKYRQFSETEQEQVRRIFIQLVRPGEGTEDTRQLATKAKLGEATWGLVKQLADARLVVTGRNAQEQETVEVVHEALIRNWGKLRQWMDIDREFRVWQDRLGAGIEQWKHLQRDEGALLRGAALVYAEEQLEQRPEDLSQEEQKFIQASVELRDRQKIQQENDRREREIAIQGLIKQQSNALANYSRELFNQRKNFGALVESLRAGILLKKIKADVPTGVVVALHQSLYKVRLCNILEGHGSEVISVAFSPDGNTIASASDDNTVKLWNYQGEEIKTLTGHGSYVLSVAFSPDGNTIASASDDNTVKLWNYQGEEIKTLTGHGSYVLSVAFSPDGNTIASASLDKTVKLWNYQGEEIKTLTGHDSEVISVAFSPDGNTIASASLDKTVKLWNYQGEEIKTLTGHDSEVISVAFSPNGNTIATASHDKTVKLWNLQGQEIKTLSGHAYGVNSVAFSPNGNTIATASHDKTVKLWNLQGQEIKTLSGHAYGVMSVAFSPNGNTIATASHDKTVKLWNLQGQEIKTLSGHAYGVMSVAFSPDGNTIASASADKTVKLWNLQGQEIKTLSGHAYGVMSVAFSPNSNTIASASFDNTVKLWNLQGQEIKTLSGHDERVNSVVFSPDGNTIASASFDNTVKLWNLQGQEIKTLSGHDGRVNSVAFSPDGNTIASASDDYTMKLWNLQGQEIKTLSGHDERVNSVAFSPDGNTIASASFDNTVKLWNLQGQEIKTLSGHGEGVMSVAFSPDGNTIATASHDKTVKLWNLQGQEIKTLSGHGEGVMSVAFSPDGNTIASASYDNTVKLWNFDLDDLLVRGCNWARGYLKNNPNVNEEDRRLCD